MIGELAIYSPSSERNTVRGCGRHSRNERLTDENGPDVDEDKQCDIGKLLQRKNIGKDVIGDALRETVKGVEGMARIGAGHDPSVMGFMQGLVE